MTDVQAFGEAERAAVYRVIAERRDVRQGYLETPLPEDLLCRLIAAAHCAPSVGLMQPSRFIVIRDRGLLQVMIMRRMRRSPGPAIKTKVSALSCLNPEGAVQTALPVNNRRNTGRSNATFRKLREIETAAPK